MSEAGRYKVLFKIEGIGEAKGELIRIKSPLTAESIYRAVPLAGKASVWMNGEVYFPAGIKRGLEKATRRIEKGDIAYWPLGDAICIFYEKIEPYSDVNVVGRILDNLKVFGDIKLGTKIVLDKA
jgi:hypothetical protein